MTWCSMTALMSAVFFAAQKASPKSGTNMGSTSLAIMNHNAPQTSSRALLWMLSPVVEKKSQHSNAPGAQFLVASTCLRLPIARGGSASYGILTKGEPAASVSLDGKSGAVFWSET